MVKVTRAQIRQIMPHAKESNIILFLPFINEAMETFKIDTTIRQCHFLAQIAQESGSLNYVEEIASGEQYEFRKDLGNTEKGDGIKYKGRGLIQLTGRANYQRFQDWLTLNGHDVDIMNHPEVLEQKEYAALVAGWFWDVRNINVFADRDNVVSVTKKVNGGRNGLDERTNYLNSAKLALGWL